MEYRSHYSVLGREVLKHFQETPIGENLFADLTLGATGHTSSILNEIENSKVIAFDQDPDAVKNASEKLKDVLDTRLKICPVNFENFVNREETKEKKFRGIIIDLGVSSHHFDCPERGFSFRFEGPLDMRMDPSQKLTAAELLNSYDDESLVSILEDYGEERFAVQIVKAIREYQKSQGELTNTKQLEDIVFHAYPKKMRFSNRHPATKTFQALRIAVNRELEVIEKTVPLLFDYLQEGGKLVIISFHSLEDRIVKNLFRDAARGRFELKNLTKKPILPQDDEIQENSRSRSAKLRVLERKTSEEMESDKDVKKERYKRKNQRSGF